MEGQTGESFEEFFADRLKEHNLTLKRLSELTGISMKNLTAIASGNFADLPSMPYFRGYIIKLGRILEFDPDSWWIKFKEGGLVKDAGSADMPPRNRYIRPPLLKFFWIGGIALLTLFYIVFRFANVVGRPIITVDFPQGNPATVGAGSIELSGTMKNGSNLYVNGEDVSVGSDGSWKKSVLLQSSTVNVFEITAKKFLGGETKIIEQIVYEPGRVAGQ